MAKKSTSTSKSKVKYSKETYTYWFESMLLMRRFEEKAGQLYGQQKNQGGFCHLVYRTGSPAPRGLSLPWKKDDKWITAYSVPR